MFVSYNQSQCCALDCPKLNPSFLLTNPTPSLETLLSVLLGVYPETELLKHIIISFLVFWWTAIFSTVGCTVLHFCQQSPSGLIRALISVHPCQHLLLFCFIFWIVAILMCVKMVSHLFDLYFLNDSNIEHSSKCLFMFSSEKCLCPFLNHVVLLLNFKSALYSGC